MASARTVTEQLQNFDMSQGYYPNVRYNNVVLTYAYRKERPYRLLRHTGDSSVSMTFGLSGAEHVSKIILELNHCGTTSYGVIDIIINGELKHHNLSTPVYNFEKQVYSFPASSFQPKNNEIKIKLGEQSPGVYWLSDALVSVERKVDQAEEAIEERGRKVLVGMRKHLKEGEKLVGTLRKIADELDELHLVATKVKATGEAVKITGYLLILGGAALEVLSAGAGTPIVAAMEAGGEAIVVGGTVVDTAAEVVDDIQQLAHVAVAQILLTNERAYLKETLEDNKKLGDILQQSGNASCRTAGAVPADPIVVNRNIFLTRFALPSVISSTEIGKGISTLKIMESLSLASMAIPLSIPLAMILDAAFTFCDLMKHVAEIVEGKPAVMAEKLRHAADSMEEDLHKVRLFLEDTLNILLKQLRNDLDESNLRSVARLFVLLPLFDEIQANEGKLNMSWVNMWKKFENELSQERRTNMGNALNQIYQEMKDCFKKNASSNELDLVIIAHGSVGVPTDQMFINIPGLATVIPTTVLFSAPHLTSVTFYQPWGVLIDARANYAIVRGTIQPNQTRFDGVGTSVTIPNFLTRFNELNTESNVVIPNAWCNSINDNDQALNELLRLIAQGGPCSSPRHYVWWRMGSVPSFMLTAMAGISAMLLSPPQARLEVRIHHGMCLNWPSTDQSPPDPLLGLHQYYNAIGETYRNPFTMTIV